MRQRPEEAAYRILVAEDDPASRLMLSRVLEGRGYLVSTAGTYAEAHTAALAAAGPQLLLLDRMLPGGDALDICRAHRAAGGLKYIVLLTSRDAKSEVVEGFRAGANDYLTKPFHTGELLARVTVGARFVALRLELEAKITELRDALGHVKKLQGLLPICMHCHKIRTDRASWERIESYLSAHAEVRFSHGICPDCEKKHYGGE